MMTEKCVIWVLISFLSKVLSKKALEKMRTSVKRALAVQSFGQPEKNTDAPKTSLRKPGNTEGFSESQNAPSRAGFDLGLPPGLEEEKPSDFEYWVKCHTGMETIIAVT